MAGLVVGVPKEIKEKEGRVSVQPDGVAELVYDGREVVVQAGAGSGCGFPDDEYVAAGARVVGTADEVFAAADLIVKVKEPIPPRNMTGSARVSSCSPTCTWRPTAGSPSSSLTDVSTRSHTRLCRQRTGGCRCSRR